MRRFLFTGACLFLLSCSISAQSKLNGPSSKTKKLEEKISILGREYSRMIQRNDRAAIERTLSDDYLLADEEGKVFTKSEDLATYTEERGKTLKIEKIEYLDQKVRLIRDDVAIDHSTIRFTGMKNGKPFVVTERCTTIWAFRNGRWQIVSDHFSYVKP